MMKRIAKKRHIVTILLTASIMSLTAGRGFSADDYNDPTDGKDSSELVSKDPNIYVPPGMELRKMGSSNAIMPAGAHMRKEGSLMIMEGADEYMARNIDDMKGRIGALERRQAELEKELNDLKQTVSKPQEMPFNQAGDHEEDGEKDIDNR